MSPALSALLGVLHGPGTLSGPGPLMANSIPSFMIRGYSTVGGYDEVSMSVVSAGWRYEEEPLR